MDKKEEDPKAEIELVEVGQSNENHEKERGEREEEGEEQKGDEEKRGDSQEDEGVSQEDEGVEVAKLKSKGKGKKKFKLTFENCNPLDKIPQVLLFYFHLISQN